MGIVTTRRDALKTMAVLAAAPAIGLPAVDNNGQAFVIEEMTFARYAIPSWTMVKVQFNDLLEGWYNYGKRDDVNGLLEFLGDDLRDLRYKGKVYAKREWPDRTEYIAIELESGDYDYFIPQGGSQDTKPHFDPDGIDEFIEDKFETIRDGFGEETAESNGILWEGEVNNQTGVTTNWWVGDSKLIGSGSTASSSSPPHDNDQHMIDFGDLQEECYKVDKKLEERELQRAT